MASAPVILANAEIRDEFIADGMQRLRRGASAGDVAESIACAVEDDPDEHTVGYSGWPNILGEVELDASFMDGATLRAGAVAALKGFRHPISVARQVMLRLPHVLLAGEGAARFAIEIGAERRDMLSPEAQAAWQQRIAAVVEDEEDDAITLTVRALRERRGSDTMNVIVRDAAGNICSAVSTSGIAWKYPGRVGDSPIIGAGNYCDNRYGAATCMGLGEAAMRIGAAVQAVMLMRLGWSLEAAGCEVVRQLSELLGESTAENHMSRADWVRILVMDAAGNVGAFATRLGLRYKVQTADDSYPLTREVVCPA
ncbi:MAG: isoaspartyl peptidase/L-asparaginase [Anaerolineae bacterium]|nr:isoaspartyl peptidase/L-asparaginase [Candidatus Roseilinea sp.]MDW8451743.1 isoaspartyl peptidase/L-asparaginase [Anaerolineae bacterium]